MAELTTGLKQRFAKDYKLPIKLYTEPYFTERIEALDFLYGSKKSLVLLSIAHTGHQYIILSL